MNVLNGELHGNVSISYDRRRLEEMKALAEQERLERVQERQRKIDAGEPLDDDDEEGENGWKRHFRSQYHLTVRSLLEMAQVILDDQKYEPKKEDFIDKIPETIPEGHRSLDREERDEIIHRFLCRGRIHGQGYGQGEAQQ